MWDFEEGKDLINVTALHSNLYQKNIHQKNIFG